MLSVGEKMQARLKPMLQVVQSRLGGMILELVFAIRKKDRHYWLSPSCETQLSANLFYDSNDTLIMSN